MGRRASAADPQGRDCTWGMEAEATSPPHPGGGGGGAKPGIRVPTDLSPGEIIVVPSHDVVALLSWTAPPSGGGQRRPGLAAGSIHPLRGHGGKYTPETEGAVTLPALPVIPYEIGGVAPTLLPPCNSRSNVPPHLFPTHQCGKPGIRRKGRPWIPDKKVPLPPLNFRCPVAAPPRVRCTWDNPRYPGGPGGSAGLEDARRIGASASSGTSPVQGRPLGHFEGRNENSLDPYGSG